MKLTDKVIIITGAARGIGKALALRFATEKPRAIIVADRDLHEVQAVAREINAVALECDVSREANVQALVHQTLRLYGQVDLFCSNAGIGSGAGLDAPDSEWQRLWDINLMSHVWAARALLPGFAARKEGYLMITASAAGLLAMVGDAPYTVTKHAAVSFAEWLSITYGASGMKVSALCPQFVNTDLLKGALGLAGGPTIAAAGPILEPQAVADYVVGALDAEKFLMLPHAEVATYWQKKAGDPDRWLHSMRKLQAMTDAQKPR